MISVRIKVTGPFACFTRPEFKVERVSYEMMTPTAARGILESILWKPAIRWQIDRIAVLRPIQWQRCQRNELLSPPPLARRVHKAVDFCIEDHRLQRSSLILKDVGYRIDAHFVLTERAGADDHPEKFASMFRRRLVKGQCFHQPYLGCREFSAAFAEDDLSEAPIAVSRDLGLMLGDLSYEGEVPTPHYFRAQLEQGVLTLPMSYP